MKEETKQKIIKILKIIDNISSIILLIASGIIFSIIYYIIKVLKTVNFYEILYLYTGGIAGGGNAVIVDGIKTCAIFFIIIMILLILPITKFKKTNIFIETKKKKKRLNIYPNIFSKYKFIYAAIILVISVLLLGKTLNFDKYIKIQKESKVKKNEIYEDYYVDTKDVKISFKEKKNNLILIYLESVESSLMSSENGGAFNKSRIPELEQLALDNINFSNTDNLGGGYNLINTGWTIAATVATNTGTPVLHNIWNDYDKVNKFMPNVRGLGDVLKSEGYNLELIQGGDINFAGTNKFFTEHGNFKYLDLLEARERGLIPPKYYKWWGYEDSKLFKFAKDEITELSKKDEPFGVIMFTMDTHFKDGYLDETCEEEFNDQMSNVFACSSKMINKFVNWLKKQDFYEDTTIVIIGDHLTMQNEYFNDYPDYTRTIYNTFINSETKTKFNKNREFSALDMYPTILASLGAEIEGDQLGFGVNLFSGKKTLIEELGKDKFEYEILKESDYYNKNIFSEKEIENLKDYVVEE